MSRQVNVYDRIRMAKDAEIEAMPIPGCNSQGIYSQSSTQLYELGARRQLDDGRVYRYCYAATALYCGMGAHDGGISENFTLAVDGGQSSGAAYLTIPDTDATHTANYWKYGYVAVEGYGPWMRRIVRSTASDGSTVNLYLDTTLPSAVTTNKVQVARNPYAYCTKGSTLGAATAKITAIVCVPTIAVTAEYYFWGQTWGPCSGCPAAFFGDEEFQRVVVFHDTDGAIRESSSLIANNKHYQHAGYLMGRYTASTDHRVPLYFLTLAPEEIKMAEERVNPFWLENQDIQQEVEESTEPEESTE